MDVEAWRRAWGCYAWERKGAADRLEHLPTVSACYNLLHLPPYPNQQTLELKLTQAVRLADVGFHYERDV